jgi:hypothetical protein
MSRLVLASVVLVQLTALTVVCLLVGDNGWDDGAITLAFARTFAQHGRIALTSSSEVVEGFSTVSWFLLNGGVALVRPSYHGAILASQLLSVFSICASTVLLARSCSLLGFDKLFSYLTVLLFAGWGCSFFEASNGMEMGLLAVAFLLMVNELLSPRPRLPWLAAGVVLAVTTRFEALAYVALLASAVLLLRQRRAFWVIFLTTAATVVVLSTWRLVVFADLVPNTYWAKRWPPYAEFDALGRLIGAVELPRFFVVPLVVLALLPRFGFDLAGALRGRRPACLLLAAPVLGAILVGGLVGRHWGYDGRMPYFAFPLVLLLFSLTFSPWVQARRSNLRIAVTVGAGLCSLGASLQSLPTSELAAALDGGSFGVSPRTYAETAQVVRRVAAAAELAHPTVLTPDVGGLALCCDELRVVDLSLLSNRLLARRGYAALPELLAAESPEVIEAHGPWASLGHLYALPYFRAHYLPAFAGATKLWVEREVAQAIASRGRGCLVPVDHDELRVALAEHRYAGQDTPEDRRAFRAPGLVLTLAQGGACATFGE